MSVYEKAAFSNVNHLFHDQDRSCINTISTRNTGSLNDNGECSMAR